MTISPGKYNLFVYQGATLSKTVTWKDENGALVNLTGYTAQLQMRVTVDAATPFLTLTTSNGGITLGGAAGTINLLASASATSAIQATQGLYALEMTAPDGVTITRLLEGIVFMLPEVTR